MKNENKYGQKKIINHKSFQYKEDKIITVCMYLVEKKYEYQLEIIAKKSASFFINPPFYRNLQHFLIRWHDLTI